MANPNKPPVNENDKEYSPDTLAIIERLKREGSMIRNGKNSIKSVNINLDKFSKVFNNIDKNVKQMANISKWVANRDNNNILAGRENEQRKDDLEEITQNQKEKDDSDDNKSNDPLKDRIVKNAKGLGSLLMNLGKFSLIGVGAFEFLRGFIDELTDGKMTEGIEHIKNIDFKGLMTTIGSIGGLATGIAAFGTAIAGFKIAGLFGTLLGIGLPGAGGGGLLKKMGKVVGRGGLVGMAALMFMYGEKISDWIRSDLMGMSKDEIQNSKLEGGGLANVGTRMAQFATVGAALGGIKGALIGAAIGLLYGTTEAALGYLDDKINDTGTLPNAVQESLDRDREYMENGSGTNEDKARNRAAAGKSTRRVAEETLAGMGSNVKDLKDELREEKNKIEKYKDALKDTSLDRNTRNALQRSLYSTEDRAAKVHATILTRFAQKEELQKFLRDLPEEAKMFDELNKANNLFYISEEDKTKNARMQLTSGINKAIGKDNSAYNAKLDATALQYMSKKPNGKTERGLEAVSEDVSNASAGKGNGAPTIINAPGGNTSSVGGSTSNSTNINNYIVGENNGNTYGIAH